MKTTVEIPDHLFIAAKKKAAELRKPLKDIMEEALRRELKRLEEPRPAGGGIEWIVVEGGLPRGLDVSKREDLTEWLLHEKGQ
jgi:hypothetical protein